MLRADYGQRARLLLVLPNGATRVLSEGFESACDPDVSFDATRILFAGKRQSADRWNIYEQTIADGRVRQVTREMGDCRSPCYQGTLYTLDSPKPWYQCTFVGNLAGTTNEHGAAVATHLYSSRLDGSDVRRLSFNLSSDLDPVVLYDGRVLFASWQRATLDRGLLGRVEVCGLNTDGTDFALFAGQQERRIRHMLCATAKGLVVFVETDQCPWDGAGQLACVSTRRPLHSYRQISRPADGLFHSPSPLPDGRILVSRRTLDANRPHAVCRLDPASGQYEPIFADPRYHCIQAKLLLPRAEPDGRSSNVQPDDPHGKLYCLDVHTSELRDPHWLPAGTAKRLRVLEGVPWNADLGATAGLSSSAESTVAPRGYASNRGTPGLVAPRRVLGEIAIEEDGSFNVAVPANTPIQLQTLDADGMALRTCTWIWTKNHEARGCIGCHEDGELVPDDRFAAALGKPSIELCLPPARRRTTDFCRDVMPILRSKCVSCHRTDDVPPRLDTPAVAAKDADGRTAARQVYDRLLTAETAEGARDYRGKYVQPGAARLSPLVWHVLGRNTSRPWDGAAAQRPVKPIPHSDAEPLSAEERQVLLEWIDMGALWDARWAADRTPSLTKSDERGNP